MAIDYFAVASNGYFPPPTPANDQRMVFAATWGYLAVVPAAVAAVITGPWGLQPWESPKGPWGSTKDSWGSNKWST